MPVRRWASAASSPGGSGASRSAIESAMRAAFTASVAPYASAAAARSQPQRRARRFDPRRESEHQRAEGDHEIVHARAGRRDHEREVAAQIADAGLRLEAQAGERARPAPPSGRAASAAPRGPRSRRRPSRRRRAGAPRRARRRGRPARRSRGGGAALRPAAREPVPGAERQQRAGEDDELRLRGDARRDADRARGDALRQRQRLLHVGRRAVGFRTRCDTATNEVYAVSSR